MNIFDQFDFILANYSKKEEILFLKDIRDFAENHRETVIQTFGVLFKDPGLNIQLKYLLLKSVADLRLNECAPMIREVLTQETRVQIIHMAINTLAAIGSFSAYRVLVDFYFKNKPTDLAERAEKGLRELFKRNSLAFHFDVFYRNRGNILHIQKSSENLIRRLPDDYVNDLVPCLTSEFLPIRYETLRILKHRPNAAFYSPIFQFLNANFQAIDEDSFLLASETLIVNAAVSKAKNQIFQKLKNFVPKLDGTRKVIFCIHLFSLNNRELIHYIQAVYPHLPIELKRMVLRNLDPKEYTVTRDFLRGLMTRESNDDLLSEIIAILMRFREFQFLFETVDADPGPKKYKLLLTILENYPRAIDRFIKNYVTPTQDKRVLLLCIEYLIKNYADKYFALIKSVFFSRVTLEIKSLIIRNVDKWKPSNQKIFMDLLLSSLAAIRGLTKDFLLSLLGTINRKLFDETEETKVLDQILVLMEESSGPDIAHFLYFFETYTIRTPEDKDLIIDELRLIQNTLLKSQEDQNLVRLIHVLIKKIEKKSKPIHTEPHEKNNATLN
ncbi:MAG: hypothetical protein ACM3SY_04715 [Candidatus Omnitrophota bacterium]